jgi:hypothetical protein
MALTDKLTDKAVRAAKPDTKARKLADGGGLHLLVTKAGGRLWRLKYRFGGKEKQLAIGAYPSATLKVNKIKHITAPREGIW